MTPLSILKEYFGYQSFRSGQEEIIESVVSGTDTLALLATGGGKSLCFQVPGLVLGGTTIVISPLISLMKDQVETLIKKGIKATFINSSLSTEEQLKRLSHFEHQFYDFVYISPEKVLTEKILSLSQKILIKLVVVDEAHCISEWGHDFRLEYRSIAQFIDALPQRPIVMAVTATATRHVRDDICQILKLKTPHIFVNTFRRANLSFFVIPCLTQTAQVLMLMQLLDRHKGQAGIIYAATREMTERLIEIIARFDFYHAFSVKAYHGGLSHQQRSSIQEEFQASTKTIIIATNAFGMGIDKSNIRFVIHYHFPASLEHYYQEAGRAGRDQSPAKCYLLFNQATSKIHMNFIQNTQSKSRQQTQLKQLQAIIQYASQPNCRTRTLLSYFGEASTMTTCSACDVCLDSEWNMTHTQHNYNQKLIVWQQQQCSNLKLQPSAVLHPTAIKYLMTLQPRTPDDLKAIPSLGTGWHQKWRQSYAQFFFNVTV